MLLPGEIGIADARAVLAARPAGGYGSSVRFWGARPFEGRKQPSDVADGAVRRLPHVLEAEFLHAALVRRSEEHTSELQSLMRISYAVFGLKTKKSKRITRQHKYDT